MAFVYFGFSVTFFILGHYLLGGIFLGVGITEFFLEVFDKL